MKTNSKLIRSITEAGLFSAIYTVLFLFSRFLFPDLLSSFFCFIPVPLVIYLQRNDFKMGLVTLFATFFLSFIASLFSALFVVLPGLIIGLILGQMIKKHVKTWILIVTTFTLCILSDLFMSLGYFLLFDRNFFTDYIDMANVIFDFIEKLEINTVSFDVIKTLVISLIPSIILITSLLNSVAIYLISVILLVRLKISNLQEINIKSFSFPILGYVYLLLVLAVLIIVPFYATTGPIFYIFSIIANITVVLSIVMFYQYISWLAVYCTIKENRTLYILFTLLGFLLLPIASLVGAIVSIGRYIDKLKEGAKE